MNNTTIFGVIIALIIGAMGGYFVGRAGTSPTNDVEVARLLLMMKGDGERMDKAGTMMVTVGALMQEKGMLYKDQDMVMQGKDLSAVGTRHQHDGMSMMEGDMMGVNDESMDMK